MVLLFIADLAFTLAFKLGAWCLGKTYNGIAYLVTYKNQPPKTNARDDGIGDDVIGDDDCVIITMTRQEYDALKHSSELHQHQQNHHASSSSSSSSECASSSSSK
jgi:hypothetical protein